jgi:predicted dehydrogenase
MATQPPIRFGITGTGGIAGFHASVLKDLEGEGLARLVAGADPSPKQRQAFTGKWGVPVEESLEKLLARGDIDAVSVCSPSGMHGQNCIEIAKSGRHALTEKPLDLKYDKAKEAVETAQKNGVVLGGIFQQRFSEATQKVKRAIDQGYFGQIILCHGECPWYRDQAYYDSGKWRGTWEFDGGVMSNQAPHMIDRLLWLAGDVDDVLCAAARPGFLRNIEAETLATANLKFKNGAMGTIIGTTLAYEGMPQRVMVCGTDGSAVLTGDDLTYFKTRKEFADAGAPTSPTFAGEQTQKNNKSASDPLAMPTAGHLANMRDFCEALRNGRPPLVSGEDLLRVVRVLNLIYTRANVGPYAKK